MKSCRRVLQLALPDIRPQDARQVAAARQTDQLEGLAVAVRVF
jgi:hypothetical protein